MRAGRSTCAVAALGLSMLLGTAVVSADPASSADSAWLALPSQHESELSDPLQKRGREVYEQRCVACHGAIPEETFGPAFLPPMPGTQVLRQRYGDALPAELDSRTDLSAPYVAAVVRSGLGSMPFFRPTEVSDDDLEALLAYLTREQSTAE